MNHHRRLVRLSMRSWSTRRILYVGLALLVGLQLYISLAWNQSHRKVFEGVNLINELSRSSASLDSWSSANATLETVIPAVCDEYSSADHEGDVLAESVELAKRSGHVVPCRLYALRQLDLSVCAGKCIVAANLYNSEKVMPNMLVHLLWTAHLLGPANLFVSIYESGSTDMTPDWLRLTSAVLKAISVQHIITVGGNMTRAQGQDRITFLASVRQAALDQVLTACNRPARSFCNASRIIYLNDVFFDAPGLIRLLQFTTHDIACGLDFEPILAEHPPPKQRSYMAQHLQRTWHLPSPLSHLLSSFRPAFKLWRRAYRRAPSLLRLLPLSFYDIWVARDISGGRFLRPSPYTSHSTTAARLQAGLPVNVLCCWNGMASLPGPPLLSRRVAFRSHHEGECAASECSLLCDDLAAAGYRKGVVDPGVRVAYRWEAAEKIFALPPQEGGGGCEDRSREAKAVRRSGSAVASGSQDYNTGSGDAGRSDDGGGGRGRSSGGCGDSLLGRRQPEPSDLRVVEWSPSLLVGLQEWRRRQGKGSSMECCDLLPGQDGVDFAHGCRRVPRGVAVAGAPARGANSSV